MTSRYASDLYDLRDLAQELTALSESTDLCDEDKDRLAALKELDSEFTHGGGGMAEYANGISPTLIEEGYFEDYARELAADVSGVSMNGWPFSHIDWEAAADQLKQDYHSVTFEGRDYWIRG